MLTAAAIASSLLFATGVAAPFYACGVIAAFAIGAFKRTDAKDTVRIYSRHPAFGTSDERIDEAHEEYRQGCKLQTRCLLWPIDGARWVKKQALTAYIEKENA